MKFEDILGDYCFRCGKTPMQGDLWKRENAGGVIRQGHVKCFELERQEKLDANKPKKPQCF